MDTKSVNTGPVGDSAHENSQGAPSSSTLLPASIPSMLPYDDENAWNEYVKKQNERVINILKSHGAVEKTEDDDDEWHECDEDDCPKCARGIYCVCWDARCPHCSRR